MQRRTLLRAGAGALAASTLARTVAASGTTAYEPSGELEIDGAAEVVLDDDGSTAYVAASTGFVTVDVSDPANPTVLAEERPIETGGGSSAREILDIKVDGDKLLVPTAAQGGGPLGFFLYDVSDPAEPTRIGDFFDTPHGNHNSFIEDDVVYLTGNTQQSAYLNMIDVSGEAFEQLGRWSPSQDLDAGWGEVLGKVLHDMYVQDGMAYCAYWDAGTFVVDVSDPTDPEFVVRIGDYAFQDLREWKGSRASTDYTEPRGNAHYVEVNDDASILGVGRETWDTQTDDDHGGPAGISLYDISDPTSPTHLSTIEPPMPADGDTTRSGTWTTSHNFQFVGDRLYTSWYQGGVKVFDVSDPTGPEQLSWWRDPSYAFWTAVSTPDVGYYAATSYSGVPGAENEGLLLFPDEAGEQSSPPSSLVDADPLLRAENEHYVDLPSAFGSDGGDGGESTATPTATPEPTPTATPTQTDTPTPTERGGDGGSPGFGALTAIAGLGLGAARFLRGRDEK
ncbi:LVIVD repeat-containing protein [Haloarchaeobius litoreus]|uniref:LVIVD repeat-containing protein n=1 Tax=Haloarchaeobius litoreus TaxID=755306 RepID=A0ABD6DFP8_9EURY|nr:hypothetical protein [Haloarchaeobius litoreus]